LDRPALAGCAALISTVRGRSRLPPRSRTREMTRVTASGGEANLQEIE
jgi:hypothetical protein